MTEELNKKSLTRRNVVKGAAWSVPVIATAVAAPMAAATGVVDNVLVTGHCGGLGLLGQGFRLNSGGSTIPANSTLTITAQGLLNLSAITWDLGGLEGVLALGVNSNGTRSYTFTSAWSGNDTFGALITVGLLQGMTATLSFPPGTTQGSNNKLVGSFYQVAAFLCDDD